MKSKLDFGDHVVILNDFLYRYRESIPILEHAPSVPK